MPQEGTPQAEPISKLKQFRFQADGKKKPHTFFKKTAVLDDIRVPGGGKPVRSLPWHHHGQLRHGSGVGPNQKSISHREIIRAVSQQKLRWFLVHHDVVVARQLIGVFQSFRRHAVHRVPVQGTVSNSAASRKVRDRHGQHANEPASLPKRVGSGRVRLRRGKGGSCSGSGLCLSERQRRDHPCWRR